MVKKTPEEVRAMMTEFCVREAKSCEDLSSYIAALTSAAHLCDQISQEATTRTKREAAKDCGDFIWSVADAVKALRKVPA